MWTLSLGILYEAHPSSRFRGFFIIIFRVFPVSPLLQFIIIASTRWVVSLVLYFCYCSFWKVLESSNITYMLLLCSVSVSLLRHCSCMSEKTLIIILMTSSLRYHQIFESVISWDESCLRLLQPDFFEDLLLILFKFIFSILGAIRLSFKRLLCWYRLLRLD